MPVTRQTKARRRRTTLAGLIRSDVAVAESVGPRSAHPAALWERLEGRIKREVRELVAEARIAEPDATCWRDDRPVVHLATRTGATLCGTVVAVDGGAASYDPRLTSCQACAASPDHPWRRDGREV